jgi:RecA/RadA recombinase
LGVKEARAIALLSELRAKVVSRDAPESASVHKLDWPELEALLPDGGFARGSVVELASAHAVGGSSLIAVRLLAAMLQKDPRAHAAWIDPDETLYGPGVARAGVDLSRLLVVRPPAADLGRIAVKVVASGAFDLVVIEMDPVHGAAPRAPAPRAKKGRRAFSNEVVVRKLALAAEATTVLLLTDSRAPRALPWPVALRLELSRKPDQLSVCVAKDRRGRMSPAKSWIALK